MNRFITLVLGGSTLLLASTLIYPIKTHSTQVKNTHGICVSLVDLLSNQLAVHSVISISESGLIEQIEMNNSYHQERGFAQRGSERHR